MGLADSYRLLPWMSEFPPEQARDKAQAALAHALALDPISADAHAARGAQLEEAWRFRDAEAALRRALELDERHATAHQWLGELLINFRRDDEAILAMDRAVDLDPLSAPARKNRSSVLFFARRFADAEREARAAIELDPTQPYGRGWLGYSLVWQGRFDEGLAEIRADPMAQPTFLLPYLRVQELVVASQRGDRTEVARLLAVVEASGLAARDPYFMALARAAAGDADTMFKELERAFAMRARLLPQVAVHPVFDRHRTDPRMISLLGRLGLDHR